MSTRLAVLLMFLWALAALLADLLSLNPDYIQLHKILQGPGSMAWLGYDDLGRSIAERLVMGAKTSFMVSFAVVLVSSVFGIALGISSAWLGGFWDHLLVRIMDVFLAFPGILLAIALAGVLGPGIENVVIALAVIGWVGYARLARAQTLSVKHRDHVQASQALGRSVPSILWCHILPLILAPLIIEATFGIAAVVIAEAGLSFLGLGVQAPAASWGSMIRDGSRYLLVAPHMVIAPGLAMFLVVLSINKLGDALRDHLDVRLDSGKHDVASSRDIMPAN